METDIVKLQKIAAAVEKIRKARTNLLMSSPFFGQFSVLPVLQPSYDFDGFATDGEALFFNPDFVIKQSFDDLKVRLANITIKPALKHHVRRGERKQKLWVQASEYAANDVLRSFGFKLPEDLKYRSDFHDKCAESIYLTLAQQEMQKGPGNGDGDNDEQGDQDQKGGGEAGGGQDQSGQDQQSGGGSDQNQGGQDDQQGGGGLGNSVILDGKQKTDAEKRLEEAKWNAALKSAAVAARACGRGSSALDRFVEAATSTQLPWKEILARFLTLPAQKKIDWSRPSRKMIQLGFFFATRSGKEMEDPVMLVDTSGSISDKEISVVGNQAHALVADMGCGLHVVYVDSDVRNYEYIEATTYPPSFKLKPKGGGGTDFRPGFEYIQKKKIFPSVVIYLTDGYCDKFPGKAPECDVLWVLVAENRKFKPPFGEVVYLN